MEKVLLHFKNNDPILYEVAIKFNLENWNNKKQKKLSENELFINLVESIISQQLSVKASDTIFNRFKKLFKEEQIVPQKLLKIPDQEIRECGISFSKIKYIKGIALAVVNKEIELDELDSKTNEEVILELIKLKGVGTWTAEMFLMFTLNRPDVFSAGDLGLLNAIVKIYKLEKKPTKEELIIISEKWSPYRTYACLVLWKSLELK